MKKLVFSIFFCFYFFSVFGQISPKHTFNMEIGIPVPMTNPYFKGLMKSVISSSPYYQYRLPNSLAFGAGVLYTYFQVDKFKVPTAEPAKGGVHTIGCFGKISHEKFHTEQFATDFGVKIGYSKTYFKTDYNDSLHGKALSTNSMFVIPTVGFILSVDEFTSYRFSVGYAFQGYSFSPHSLGISTNSGYNTAKFSHPTSCLIVGFGFTHYFGQNGNSSSGE